MYEYTLPKRMKSVKDLTGQTFGRLTVVRLLGKRSGEPTGKMFWLCSCECGEPCEIHGSSMVRGKTISCGCYRRERATTHGATAEYKPTPEYRAWKSLKERCNNPNVESFGRYGGRGVKVCTRWLESFESFLEDMGPRPSDKHSIERRDNNKDYSPDNCYWATLIEQANNKSNNVLVDYKSKSYTVAQLARHLGLEYGSLYGLYRRYGYSLPKAIARAKPLEAHEPTR